MNVALILGAAPAAASRVAAHLAGRPWRIAEVPVAEGAGEAVEQSVRSAVAGVLEKEGRLDLLILAYADLGMDRVMDTATGTLSGRPREILRRCLACSLAAVQAVLPVFRRQGYGSIVPLLPAVAGSEWQARIRTLIWAAMGAGSGRGLRRRGSSGLNLSFELLREPGPAVEAEERVAFATRLEELVAAARRRQAGGKPMTAEDYRWIARWNAAGGDGRYLLPPLLPLPVPAFSAYFAGSLSSWKAS